MGRELGQAERRTEPRDSASLATTNECRGRPRPSNDSDARRVVLHLDLSDAKVHPLMSLPCVIARNANAWKWDQRHIGRRRLHGDDPPEEVRVRSLHSRQVIPTPDIWFCCKRQLKSMRAWSPESRPLSGRINRSVQQPVSRLCFGDRPSWLKAATASPASIAQSRVVWRATHSRGRGRDT